MSIRTAFQGLFAIGATVLLGYYLHQDFPIGEWLLWDFARIWAWQLLFCVACVSAGNLVLTRLRLSVPRFERAVVSMATGVVLFVLGMYTAGALSLLNAWFAVLLPLVMTLAGLPAAYRALRDWRATPGSPSPDSGWLAKAMTSAGAIAASLLYLQCLTPDSLSYDATWTHLSIAEDYARQGRILAFDADVAKNLPHLSSLLYTWAFLVPGYSEAPLRWMTAQHLEFSLFSWTVAGVVPAARWLLDRDDLNAAWVAFFLFPAYYVYDSNLGGGSDHVAAFFAIPLLLATVRGAENLSPRWCGVAGLLAGAALHAKFQSIYLVGPLAAYLGLRVALGLARKLRGREGSQVSEQSLWVAPLAFAGFALLALGPHFVRNWVFHKNPVYPLLFAFFPSTPSFPDSPTLMEHLFFSADIGPQAFGPRLLSSLRLMFTFSLDPQYSFIGKSPFFGSLFTLLIPLTLLQWNRRRLLLGLLLAQASVWAWAYVYPIDRNLQLLLPWLVAVCAATIAATWKSAGRVARLTLLLVVALQTAWCATLAVSGGVDRLRAGVGLVRMSLDHVPRETRYAGYRAGFRALGKALPKSAVLLLHTGHLRLGIDRTTVSDWAGWQYAIDYRTMRTPRDVYLRYAELGITHLAWNNRDFPASKQEDVLFVAFSRRHAIYRGMPGGFVLWEMPAVPPAEQPPLEVLMLGMPGYANGTYSVDKLGMIDQFPAEIRKYPPPDVAMTTPARFKAAIARVDAIVRAVAAPLAPADAQLIRACFDTPVTYFSGHAVLLRNTSPECASREE